MDKYRSDGKEKIYENSKHLMMVVTHKVKSEDIDKKSIFVV